MVKLGTVLTFISLLNVFTLVYLGWARRGDKAAKVKGIKGNSN